MLRKLGYSIFCAGALFSANALAITHNLALGISLEYELAPSKPEEFVNTWFWSITSTCTIRTKDSSDAIFIEALKKTGKINNTNMAQGDTLSIEVHNGDKITITADSGSKVRLTNKGQNTVFADCTT
ncbi:hypothetical protein [Legionella hackeliae]|uniref:Uncharacterized protein n=1 Tax=Legionella hackeliae TaxID=449 RepID=A0A0A8UTD8_LEGHA|nr:hypothetical protein [Legionella hackeliae]KTD14157.1 hypothetical protein Lhac_0469 [Legionella hackeliae]CEK10362.1 conserved exported protein of unknown function [Legionella hackeliae]STX47098.1 Uncharacterised protein [Legionella hackeliae]